MAKKEFADLITSKRVLGLTSAMILLYLLFTVQMSSFITISAHSIFNYFGTSSIALVGGIIGIAIGFDMLTREKESGTLRTLLSHPVFRDEVLVGKAIAAFLAITVIVFITLLVIIGVAMLNGYPPKADDAVLIAKFMLATIAYIFTMFCISLAFSAIFKSSSSSLTASIIVFVIITIVLPIIAFSVASAIAGPPPQPPQPPESRVVVNVSSGHGIKQEIEKSPEWERYQEEMDRYARKTREIANAILLLSPMQSYTNLVNSIAGAQYSFFGTVDTTKNTLTFIITPLLFLIVSYVRFTREEL